MAYLIAATEKNDASSRSHGVAIITIGQPGSSSAYVHTQHKILLAACARTASFVSDSCLAVPAGELPQPRDAST